MLLKLLAEGLILGVLLIVYCLIGIRNGAVGMVFLYDGSVRERCVELGLTTHETIKKRAVLFKTCGVLFYIAYIVFCAYAINGVSGFADGYRQMFVILLVCILIDRIVIDEWWVCRTNAWVIPGTEDLMPYISGCDKCIKWISGIIATGLVPAVIAAVMELIVK